MAQYDRTTTQEDRERLRRNPPHILLTNYMMLEYLLVRPADREAIFANHRCRFVVLDEVHTYRGALGANIALLFRRLRVHLEDARQDWRADDRVDARRFPRFVPVATSATIKSVDETGLSAAEVRTVRDEAVQGFVGKLMGIEPTSIRVIGEEREPLAVPGSARWSASPALVEVPDRVDAEEAGRILATLAGLPTETPTRESAAGAAVLWKLHEHLARRPMSVGEVAEAIPQTVPERRTTPASGVRREIEAAIVAGAALPDDVPGALRLRAHRFIRGGWAFERCVEPTCGKLYPRRREQCECGRRTAPLYLCRSCGADVLRFKGEADPSTAPLTPHADRENTGEWLLYDAGRLRLDSENADWGEGGETDRQMKERPVYYGSFDPATCSFASDPGTYGIRALLAPARNSCLVCGATAGPGSLLTPVALGTSAAVRVLAEGLVEALADQHRDDADHDEKERLLIFADSRQDAAHQARFITYAGRYDRMRRRLAGLLEEKGGSLLFSDVVQGLRSLGVKNGDNPHTERFESGKVLPPAVQRKAGAWEEAPLLDDLAVSAGYRATVLNLGLVGVRYAGLETSIEKNGGELAARLGLTGGQLQHVARCLLDEVRTRRAFARTLLLYHPLSPDCPEEVAAADWERRIKTPSGYACDSSGRPVGYVDASTIPEGLILNNLWRKGGAGGRSPSLERRFRHLLDRFHSSVSPAEDGLVALLDFLAPTWVIGSKLHGYRDVRMLLQVNADSVEMVLVHPADRFRCSVCNVKMPWSAPGAPCPACHGTLEPWPETDVEANRYVRRIRKRDLQPLVAGEHTAQLTGDARIDLETRFKAKAAESPVNVLACSPTLEMGIDVGGLEAIVLRNVPPRPDNYAQRGGRAGRRARVGVVLSYARNTPHDGYFFDKPGEMIAGEVPAPAIGLGNRDVALRHLAAIVFGLAEPGLKGRMIEYVGFDGTLNQAAVDELIEALVKRTPAAAAIAHRAWGGEVLASLGLHDVSALEAAMADLPGRIREAFARVRRQILELQKTIEQWSQMGSQTKWAAMAAGDLKRKLLGLGSDGKGRAASDADDRSSGHPMRRFAEFGILPGYEFPSEPATLRLLGDANEEEPIVVERRFGLSQYEPEAPAHARGHRWRVCGLDMASPWNPRVDAPTWVYVRCEGCSLCFDAQKHVHCPRCQHPAGVARSSPGYEFGGFLGIRDDAPVLEEEDRFGRTDRVRIHPQWNGQVVARYALACGWHTLVSRGEEIRWLNESHAPSAEDRKTKAPLLQPDAKGFYLCPSCGRLLTWVPPDDGKKGAKKAKKARGPDAFGHGVDCPRRGQPPEPLALVAKSPATVFRIRVDLPMALDEAAYQRWGQTLGYSLRAGIRHLYMLDGSEVEFCLENMWEVTDAHGKRREGCLTFIDGAVGGSGFLERAAQGLHLVSRRSIDHLDHEGCETACYRCLKAYTNQRVHGHLHWPSILSDLEALAQEPPSPIALERGDAHDPRPWLEAFDAGVGSPLELAFLRLFERSGIAVEKQVPVGPDEGGPAISTADFAIPAAKLVVYVDGAAFHTGNRLRRDRIIRERLRAGTAGWRVVELTVKDLRDPAVGIAELRDQVVARQGDKGGKRRQ